MVALRRRYLQLCERIGQANLFNPLCEH
eukprot:COSAG03_NODE_18356_length_357_cov_0.422481_1_plen_27_part_01